jgi:hypothetical protein
VQRRQSKSRPRPIDELTKEEVRDLIDHAFRRHMRERARWRAMPRPDTGVFENVYLVKKATPKSQPKASVGAPLPSHHRMQMNELRGAVRSLGWNEERLARLKSLSSAYREKPSIESYLALRTAFPKIDIHTSFSDLSAQVVALRGDCEKHGIDSHLISTSTDTAHEPDIDKLCLSLMERLAKRNKMSGPGHLQRRRAEISDAFVNYLIGLLLDGIDSWHEPVRVPGSLILLIRHQLGPLKGDFYDEYIRKRAKLTIASALSRSIKQGQKPTLRHLEDTAKQTGNPIARATAARWLKDTEFKGFVEAFAELQVQRIL